MDDIEKKKHKERFIRSVFIIDKDGAPKLLRNYEKDSSVKDKEVLFAGFFSAIQTFSQNALEKDIRDIQMGNSKYYFMSGKEYLLILEVSYEGTKWGKRKEIEKAISNLIENILSMLFLFQELGEDSNTNDLEKAIDSLVFETELECAALLGKPSIKREGFAENYRKIFENGKNIDENIHKTTWEKFKKFFKK